MTTQRAVVFLLVTGGLVLFAVQNASPPWLPLTVFGVQTQSLPLSFWLVAAIAAGVITTLLMVGLLNLYGPQFRPKSPRVGRARAKSSSRMGRTPQSGRTTQTEPGWSPASDSPSGSMGSASTPNPVSADNADAQDWGAFKPPEQWDDWGRKPNPSVVVDTPTQNASTQGKSRRRSRRQREQYAVEESFEEIAGGWNEYEESAYKESAYMPRGGSPVDDALDEISEGWDDYEEAEDNPPPPPPKDYEVKQAPKTVYRSGSLYSYSYDKTEASDANRGEDAYPTNGLDDDIDDIEDQDYPADTNESTDHRQTAPGPGKVGPDGVYEADYRVIIPPTRNLDEEDDWENGERR